MKKMKQITTTTLALCFAFTSIFAQANKQKRADKIQAARVGIITNALHLDEAAAQKFWPVYTAYTDAKKAINQERKQFQNVLNNAETASEAELDKALNGVIACNQKLVEIQKKYKVDFARVISLKQLALLHNAEKDFKEMLINRMKSNMRQGMDRMGKFGKREMPANNE